MSKAKKIASDDEIYAVELEEGYDIRKIWPINND